MSGQGSSGIGPRSELTDGHARDTVERAVEENAERFAQALLPYVAPQTAPTPAVLPGPWRGSDGVLTPPGAELLASSNAASEALGQSGDASGERVVVSVKSAELGDLSLVLDRSESGVRVVIGVTDARAAALMAPEREALLERLIGQGVRVTSVQIVGQRELGTLLAPRRSIGGARVPGPHEPSGSDGATVRRRGSRKLDVIG